ncbi:MAG: hypothetical protein M1818_004522 [Claussenomyces sp. TS43310]|nr:MAG: hypothetical protein M1818_004522 [Claussenomyces sp. TS43310]
MDLASKARLDRDSRGYTTALHMTTAPKGVDEGVGIEDVFTIPGTASFSVDGASSTKNAGYRLRRRRRLGSQERRDVHAVRKVGACERCHARKVKCRHVTRQLAPPVRTHGSLRTAPDTRSEATESLTDMAREQTSVQNADESYTTIGLDGLQDASGGVAHMPAGPDYLLGLDCGFELGNYVRGDPEADAATDSAAPVAEAWNQYEESIWSDPYIKSPDVMIDSIKTPTDHMNQISRTIHYYGNIIEKTPTDTAQVSFSRPFNNKLPSPKPIPPVLVTSKEPIPAVHSGLAWCCQFSADQLPLSGSGYPAPVSQPLVMASEQAKPLFDTRGQAQSILRPPRLEFDSHSVVVRPRVRYLTNYMLTRDSINPGQGWVGSKPASRTLAQSQSVAQPYSHRAPTVASPVGGSGTPLERQSYAFTPPWFQSTSFSGPPDNYLPLSGESFALGAPGVDLRSANFHDDLTIQRLQGVNLEPAVPAENTRGLAGFMVRREPTTGNRDAFEIAGSQGLEFESYLNSDFGSDLPPELSLPSSQSLASESLPTPSSGLPGDFRGMNLPPFASQLHVNKDMDFKLEEQLDWTVP